MGRAPNLGAMWEEATSGGESLAGRQADLASSPSSHTSQVSELGQVT